MSPSGKTDNPKNKPTKPSISLVPTRVVIDRVEPEIEGGRFAVKRVPGEEVRVLANIFSDGHDILGACLRFRGPNDEDTWNEVAMTTLENDRWSGSFVAKSVGQHYYTLQAWIDRFASWRRDFFKKVEANQEVGVDLLVGIELIEKAARRAEGESQRLLSKWAHSLRALHKTNLLEAIRQAMDEPHAVLASRFADRRTAANYKELPLVVDRLKARFSSWYEMFPRSTSPVRGAHGTFNDCEARLPYVAGMGFDVLYFPPIHPIGRSFRKGKNNNPQSAADDPGSPWAIGSEEGGHKSIHPELGTMEDFRRLLAKAKELGLEFAMDIAFQCSPDHPYVKEHPEWFRWRPDGTVQFAENPPKKYQDIYPIEFDNDNWEELWEELKSVFTFWAEQGVRIFRVDNPHTKPFPFWEWLIKEVKAQFPDAILLAEAFTRPNIMYGLAKLGFTQSYTYFTWRNSKWDLTQYFTELTQTDVREFFVPNLWPNTPDILNEYLQTGGRPAFMARLVLAATLGANYGIYGPAFELCENRPFAPGSEEYWNSEKYDIRAWDLNRSDSLKQMVTQINRIRRENPAFQNNRSLRFHHLDNDQLIAYSKANQAGTNVVLVVVNLDYRNTQSAWVELPIEDFGLNPQQPYEVHDELNDARYMWHGPRNYIELNPHKCPAHVFVIRRKVGTERDVNYYL